MQAHAFCILTFQIQAYTSLILTTAPEVDIDQNIILCATVCNNIGFILWSLSSRMGMSTLQIRSKLMSPGPDRHSCSCTWLAPLYNRDTLFCSDFPGNAPWHGLHLEHSSFLAYLGPAATHRNCIQSCTWCRAKGHMQTFNEGWTT